MLQALLADADLTPDDVEIVEYSDFGQGAAVAQGAVDAATGFANNEPVQLELTGEDVTILRVDDIVPLPGNGLIVGTSTLESKSDAVAGFIAATLRAMEEITQDPEVGLDAAITAVPELASAREVQASILAATIEVWKGPAQEARGLGAIEPSDWETSIAYLETLDLVPNPVTVDDVLETGLLPAQD
jgi:ABC-type nitrate/sulfonate/bicarbonate transport system substrate-binding protein